MKYKIGFHPNGKTTVTDESGQQIPNLQESWLILFFKFLESRGVNPRECEFTLPMRSQIGSSILSVEATPIKTEEGWNWSTKFKREIIQQKEGGRVYAKN